MSVGLFSVTGPCDGRWVHRAGSGDWDNPFDGVFLPTVVGIVRARDIADGLSGTACFAEWVHGRLVNGAFRWTPGDPPEGLFYEMIGPLASREDFVRDCRTTPSTLTIGGWLGSNWYYGAIGWARYNHQLAPGSNSCMIIGTGPRCGDVFSAFTAGSRHRGGLNLLMSDGAGRWVSNDIDLSVWRALGTRNGSDNGIAGRSSF